MKEIVLRKGESWKDVLFIEKGSICFSHLQKTQDGEWLEMYGNGNRHTIADLETALQEYRKEYGI